MDKIKLSVGGMSCQGCVNSLTKKFSEAPGVSEVEVSLENECADVEYDPAVIDEAGLKQVIEKAGFEAR